MFEVGSNRLLLLGSGNSPSFSSFHQPTMDSEHAVFHVLRFGHSSFDGGEQLAAIFAKHLNRVEILSEPGIDIVPRSKDELY